MLVYLAQPIDQTRAQHNVGEVAHLLRTVGVSWYRPAGAFALHGDPSRADLQLVDRINGFSLAAADALVAWLPSGTPTLGVPAEIEEALRSGKPTLILTNIMSFSVLLTRWETRGASIVQWDDRQSREWEADPTELYRLLNRKPDSDPAGFYEEYTAANQQPIADYLAEVGRSLSNTVELEPGWSVAAPNLPVKLEQGAFMPTRAYGDDAGLDLAINHLERLEVDECRMLPTGIRAALPDGMWGLIIGRSSTWVKYRVDVRLAVIDVGYRGELMIQAHNRGDRPITFPAGTRLAQYVLLPTWLGSVLAVDTLGEHERGENGYGSSGK